MKLRFSTEKELSLFAKKEIPDIASTYNGVCIITGGGTEMWSDFDKALEMAPNAEIMAVNLSALFINRKIDHIYSMHYRMIGHVKAIRKHEMPDDTSIVHSTRLWAGINVGWDVWPQSSFSGLAAAHIALLLGYEKVILCGIPMDGKGYFYKKNFAMCITDDTRLGEIKRLGHLSKGNVRSFSGRTKDFLGEPDKKWLEVNYAINK